MEISPLAPAADNRTQSALSAAKLADTFDKFLTLLTTQLENQDPLDPMDSSEFVNQLVQFTGVEQSVSTNKNLERLYDLQSQNRAISALGFIGRTVEASGNEIPLTEGGAEFTYTLSDRAAAAAFSITDQAGQVVLGGAVETAAGKHRVVWDGRDANGNPLPDGTYTVNVAARDADGETVGVVTGVIGQVTSVETTDDDVILSMGGVSVPYGNIVSVREAIQPGQGV